MILVSYVIGYIASYLFAASGHYYLSGAVLILCAMALYAYDYIRTENLINLRGLFSLFFVGGEGISCLKLSYLQTDWEIITWVCFFLAFIGFWLSFELITLRSKKMPSKALISKIPLRIVVPEKLFIFTIVLTAISLIAFVFEACILGFIPLFVRGVPHAYSYFHISGVHYFTVSCVLIPAMSVIWFFSHKDSKSICRTKLYVMALCDLIAFAIPLMCVSRMQFIFAVVFALFTYFVNEGRKIPIRYVVIAVAVIVAAFAALSVARSHDAEYLQSVFEMKIALPVDISRVYIYIANNYDNFNCLVRDLPGYTWGLRILFPVWALTGLKFFVPSLVNFPIYVTKTELTTVTLFYDYFYDFGVAGVFIASLLIGAIAYFIEHYTIDRCDKAAGLVYSQFALYMILAFFTTWFSNPTTWFYLGVSIICVLITTKNLGEKEEV